ncbi:D-alanyl-D-alanine carboxypeptidase family protein [Sinorhizobium medicae]
MRMKWLAAVGFLAAIVSGQAVAQTPAFDTKAKQIYLVDAETGTVLFSRDEDAPVPPASLAKLMAMKVVFEALDKGELTPDTNFLVSEHAWRTGGAPSGTSTMFAAIKSRIRVADLIQGATVQLANDACIILAEGIGRQRARFCRAHDQAGARNRTARRHFQECHRTAAPGKYDHHARARRPCAAPL